MARTSRSPVPLEAQLAVYRRDGWLCYVCRRPVIFHLALKRLGELVAAKVPDVPLAYWQTNWRRDAAPLLDELAASIDHVEAFSKGGAHDLSNFATICARCNARKSAKSDAAFRAETKPWRVRGKHGEPKHWDGMSAAFVALAIEHPVNLSDTEKRWLKVLRGEFEKGP
ncbi:MAG TPA: HNH endonuclease signature motif containing protein [Gemmatimonadales bacterium]|nr:HNH endonuclease signature motif containing protein [Gemmatimonadales bacterium]